MYIFGHAAVRMDTIEVPFAVIKATIQIKNGFIEFKLICLEMLQF